MLCLLTMKLEMAHQPCCVMQCFNEGAESCIPSLSGPARPRPRGSAGCVRSSHMAPELERIIRDLQSHSPHGFLCVWVFLSRRPVRRWPQLQPVSAVWPEHRKPHVSLSPGTVVNNVHFCGTGSGQRWNETETTGICQQLLSWLFHL